MQKLFRSLLAVGALVGLAACGDDVTVPPAQSPPLTVSGAPVTAIAVGARVQLQASEPVSWASSNTAVATVDATGLVTAVAAGTASITATATADATKKASVTITVTAPPNQVRSVTVSPSSATLNPTQTLQLVANVDADPGVARTVTWASSNTAVATVTNAGVVTAVAAGAASITATSTANTGVSGAMALTVQPLAPASVTIQSMTYNVGSLITPVDLDNVFGQIDVTLNVDPGGGQLSKVALLVDGVEVASQTFGALQAPEESSVLQQVVLSWNTAQFNPTTGAVSHRNGPKAIRAVVETRVGGSTQSAPAASVTQTVIARNLSGFIGSIVTAGGSTATDAGGFQWRSGSTTVSGIPVLYGDLNAPFTVPTVATANITIGPGVCESSGITRTLAATQSGSSWSATFSATANNAGAGNVTGYEMNPALCGGYLPIGQVPTINAVGSDGNGIFLIACGDPVGFGNGNGFLNSPFCAAFGGPKPDTRFAIRLDNRAPVRPTVGPQVSSFLNTNTTTPVIRTGNWVNDALVLNATSPDGGATGNIDGPPLVRRTVLTVAADGGSSRLNAATQITYLTRVGADNTAADAAAPITSVAGIPESDQAPIIGGTNPLVLRARAADLVGNTSGASTQNIAVDRTPPTLAMGCGGTFAADATCAVQPNPWFNGPNPLTAAVFIPFAATDAASGGAVPSAFFNLAGTPLVTSIQRVDPNIGSRFWCPASASFVTSTGNCASFITGRFFAGPLTQTFAGLGNVEGYYTITTSVSDQAGNQSGQITATGLYDYTAPAIGGISFPAFLNGGANVTFSTQANDNVDLLSGTLFLTYTAFGDNFQFPTSALGTFGSDAFTTTASVSLSTTFIRSIQVSGPAAPGAGFLPPTAVSALVTDVARLQSALSTTPIGAGSIQVGTASTAPSTNWAGPAAFNWSITLLNGVAPAAINVNRDATAVLPNVNQVTITACAAGPTGTFQNPFTSRVEFWAQGGAGATWRLIGTSTSPTVTDTGIGPTGRTWCFSTTWNPDPDYTAAGYAVGNTGVNIMAIGVNNIPVGGTLPAGDGLATPINANVTVVVP
jgi:hypothetical protein